MSAPIFSRPRYLPGSKINGAMIDHAVISDGCIINRARISNSIVGLRTIIGDGTELNRVVILGSDYYEAEESVTRNEAEGRPRVGIGAHCKIENAIIDKNARIGNNVAHLARRQAGERGSRALLHPRRHRHHPEGRRDPARHGDLNDVPPWPK